MVLICKLHFIHIASNIFVYSCSCLYVLVFDSFLCYLVSVFISTSFPSPFSSPSSSSQMAISADANG